VRGDDAIVDDEVDIWLRSQAAEDGCVVVLGCGLTGGLGCGLDCGDAEVFVAVGETGADGGDTGLRVTWDGGVAIEDEVVVGSDAGGVDLGAGQAGEDEYEDGSSFADEVAEQTRHAKSWRTGSQVAINEHAAPRCCAEVCIGCEGICMRRGGGVCYYFGLSI